MSRFKKAEQRDRRGASQRRAMTAAPKSKKAAPIAWAAFYAVPLNLSRHLA
jgi:hypothetical protein